MNQPQQPDPDALYESYDKNLYRITGDEASDDVMNMLAAMPGANNSTSVQTSVSNLGSGATSMTVNQTSGAVKSGQTLFNDGQPGYFLGVQDGVAVLSIGESTSNYLTWDGSTLTISGDISAGTITGATIIGGMIETATSGQRIVISGSTNLQTFYDSTGLVMTLGAAATYAVSISSSSVTTSGVLITLNTGAANALFITSTVAAVGMNYQNAANVANRGLFIQQTGTTSNTLPAIEVDYAGAGNSVLITNSSAHGATGMFINVTNTSGSYGLLVQSVGIDNAVEIFSTNSLALYCSGNAHITYGGSSSTLGLVGGTPTGNTGVLNISASNEGDCISLVQAANSSNFAIGIHVNLTNSGNTVKAAAMRFEGDAVVNSSVGGSQDQKVRVLIGATAYYIPCYTA